MSGVTWSERRDGDWLASNGRWYPKSSYPRFWGTTALPPAPDHGASRGLLTDSWKAVTGAMQAAADGLDATSGPPSTSTSSSSSPAPPRPSTPSGSSTPGSAARPTPSSASVFSQHPDNASPRGSGAATATVTSARTHTSRLPSGAAPRAGLPPAPSPPPKRKTPPPPGRFADDDKPPPPAQPPAPRGRVAPKMPGVGTADTASGELGQALGAARKRIEQALDELE